MAWDLPRLFAAGAHRTVEALVQIGRTALTHIVEAIFRRFNILDIIDTPTAGQLLSEVNNAVMAGQSLALNQRPNPLSYGVNPALSQHYSYTTIAQLPDPFRPGSVIDIPFVVNSDQPLTPQQIRDQATEAVLTYVNQPERGDSGRNRDIQRRDAQFETARKELGNPVDLLEIMIVSAYRQQ